MKGSNREMDLLELNKRGMEGVGEDEEWIEQEDDSGYAIRASQQTEMEEIKVSCHSVDARSVA